MDEETVIYILRETETSGQRDNHPPPPKLRYWKEGKKKKKRLKGENMSKRIHCVCHCGGTLSKAAHTWARSIRAGQVSSLCLHKALITFFIYGMSRKWLEGLSHQTPHGLDNIRYVRGYPLA